MKYTKTYKSFNDNKSLEELEYNLTIDIDTLENIKFEVQFYKSLLNKPLFRPHTTNLFETLSKFKNELNKLAKSNEELLADMNSHANQIKNKIECEDVACDNFFILEHDKITQRAFYYKIEILDFKFRFYQYLESAFLR